MHKVSSPKERAQPEGLLLGRFPVERRSHIQVIDVYDIDFEEFAIAYC